MGTESITGKTSGLEDTSNMNSGVNAHQQLSIGHVSDSFKERIQYDKILNHGWALSIISPYYVCTQCTIYIQYIQYIYLFWQDLENKIHFHFSLQSSYINAN